MGMICNEYKSLITKKKIPLFLFAAIGMEKVFCA
jgi:hypothetical protein